MTARPPAPPLVDDGARRRIAEDLGSSLVVVAGAGTGKTASLVGRVLGLLRQGAALGDMAVITFTEAAASELRTRLRQALDDALAVEPGNAALLLARAEVDEAAICTLHAFAQRMLIEHSVAAGLPPGFDVLDEVSDQAELQGALARFTDELLDDPAAEPMLLRGFVLGLDNRSLAEVAGCLHRHWDRLEGDALARLESSRPAPGSWTPADLSPVIDALDAALEWRGLCTGPDDLLLAHLDGRIVDARTLLVGAAEDEHAWLPVLAGLGNLACTYGQKGNWDNRVDEVRAACAAAEAARQQVLAEAGRPVVAELLARLAAFTLHSAQRRAAEGRLTFHDLLVHARDLLRNDSGARAALRQRYRMLLIDEFQDTDPIQVELAARLAAAADGGADLGDCRPGALFVVGDPKQSIYRFRRADIALFEQVCAAVGDEVTLDANFRSVPGIIEFVDVVFAELFAAVPDGAQAAHHPLAAVRGPLSSSSRGGAGVQLRLAGFGPEDPEGPLLALPPVVVLGGAMDGSLGEIRRAAARHAAAVVAPGGEERWPVSRPRH
ncbi:MAG: UvrD-helicase domain-containing protein, partial [Acidimicrobiales bacterium]